MEGKTRIEKWGCLELSFDGRKDGNPFKDYSIQGRFIGEHEDKTVEGFYDGDSIPAIAPSTQESNYHVYYYGFMRPMFREFIFDDNQEWDVDVINTWNMSITRYGVCRGKFRVDLDGKPYMAIV